MQFDSLMTEIFVKGLSLQVHLSDLILCDTCNNAKDVISTHYDISEGDLIVDTVSMVLNIIFNFSTFIFSLRFLDIWT